LALGLFPTTFFFRAAYSEALFLLLIVLVLYGLERAWPYLLIALIIGPGNRDPCRRCGVGGAVVRSSFGNRAELAFGIAWLSQCCPSALGPGCLRRVSMGAIR